MVSFRQRETVLDYIRIGREEGARVVVGGGIPAEPAYAQGAYIQPTVLDGVESRMRIAQEEVFGPVVVVIPFDTEEEAVRLANDTPYGLSGSIWTRDIGKAIRTARAIRSGVLSINCNSSVHTEAPFGGYKMSGVGHENGMHAFEGYTQVKNVYVDLS
jgi:betaine-aldehyde dehydrogenase